MLEDREITKQINQMTRQSPFYDKFNQRLYRNPKGYIEYETVTFQMARLLFSYQLYDGNFFEQDFTHRNSLVILNQAYQSDFASFWLNDNLFDAFYNTHLPTSIGQIKRVVPVGLLFLPPKIRNPDGLLVKWIIFYHRLAHESFLPIVLPKGTLHFISEQKDTLSWITILDDGTQYGVNRKLEINEQQIDYEDEDMYISEILRYQGNNIDTESEKEFSDKITELLIQTLLYLQLRPSEAELIVKAQLSQSLNPQKIKNTKQKLNPIILGQSYQAKTEATYRHSVQSGIRKSPITHWRRGFYRRQPYGSREKTQHKLIWIEPVLVNIE